MMKAIAFSLQFLRRKLMGESRSDCTAAQMRHFGAQT